jgi:hypothetical protein
MCETNWSVPWFDYDKSLTWRCLNLNSGRFICFTFIFVLFEESCLFVSWCVAGRCGITCSDEDRGRSRRPSVEDRGWSHRSGTQWPGDREVRWRRVRSASYTWRRGAHVSWLSLKTKVDGLSVVWHRQPVSVLPLCSLAHRQERRSFWCDFFLVFCVDCCRNSSRLYSWSTGSKSSRFTSSNCS